MPWKFNPFIDEILDEFDYYQFTNDTVQVGDITLTGSQQLFVAEEYFINDTDALTLEDTSMLAVH